MAETLEPRRLLAVTLDPAFGGGDGYTLVRMPFEHFERVPGEEATLVRLLVPEHVTRLNGGYFVHALKDERTQPDNAAAEGLPTTVVHLQFEDDGSVGSLAGDNGNGYVFIEREEYEPGKFWNPRWYGESFLPLPDGTLLVGEAGQPGDVDRHIARLRLDGTEEPGFGVRAESSQALLLDDQTGIVLTAEIVAPGSPDLREQQVRYFNLSDGSLRPAVVRPFGEWAEEAIRGSGKLIDGRDGAVYVEAQGQANGAEGVFIARLVDDGAGGLIVDESFGGFHVPGQTTPAAFVPRPFDPSAGTARREVVGATPEGRVWVWAPERSAPAAADVDAFMLLTPSGEIDPTFGDGGRVLIDFPGTNFTAGGEYWPEWTADETRFAIRADGSLVAGTGVFVGEQTDYVADFQLGVYGLRTDGTYDPRVAGADSPHGIGRAIVSADVDGRDDLYGMLTTATLWLDEQDRLLVAGEVRNFSSGDDQLASNAADVPIDFVMARLVFEQVDVSIVTDGDGQRVARVVGTAGDDRVSLRFSEGLIQVLSGPAGSESISAELDPADVDRFELLGGDGDDELANDLGDAFAGFVTLRGGAANDSLFGGGRYDRILGEEGNDSLVGGSGDQLIFGGEGNDTLFGGDGRDYLIGGAGDDRLIGARNDDLLDGGDGNDYLEGGEGDDTFLGGTGRDELRGGEGLNAVSYAALAVALRVNLADGTGGIDGADERDALSDIAQVLGGEGDDHISGDGGRNFLLGGGGNDTLLGLDGKDTLLGGAGNDLLDGGDDWDLLLNLGGGPDTLRGGGGFDYGLAADGDEVDAVEQVFAELDALAAALS